MERSSATQLSQDQERPRSPYALPAQMAQSIALTALTALGLPGAPAHEPVHGRGAHIPSSCYCA
jgi:hypothetical protein